MLLNAGENEPMPPSGRSSVVMGMSPKLMLVTLKPSTPESPTLVAKPSEFNEMPVPPRYMLLAKAISLRSTKARPATFKNVLSSPFTEAMLLPAKPFDAAQGLIKS